MTIADFQRWLNARGATLRVDGVGGPATRAAILSVFTNRQAPALAAGQAELIADTLGVPPLHLRAVAGVESAGSGFEAGGLPRILWERHHFWKRTAGRFGLTWFSRPTPGDYTIDANRNRINDSWEKLCLAACADPIRAFESASWGKFQVMGWHAKALGWDNPLSMAYAMSRSEFAHYQALAGYVRANGLVPAMRALSADPESCRAFARGYNGPGYAKGRYHERLANAMHDLSQGSLS